MPLPPKNVAAQKRHEAEVIWLIQTNGGIYDPMMPTTLIFNAIKRLEAAGKIRWQTSALGRRCGYVVV